MCGSRIQRYALPTLATAYLVVNQAHARLNNSEQAAKANIWNDYDLRGAACRPSNQALRFVGTRHPSKKVAKSKPPRHHWL
jgi:hypothetical protein